jgi:AcrR family transcriptional regulator
MRGVRSEPAGDPAPRPRKPNATAGRRPYRSPRRRQQAAETRAAVLAAATELFGAQGWAATGMSDIAAAAGVSTETVYATYRTKASLLLAAVDAAVVGDLEPVALADRPEFAALGAGTRVERLAAFARLVTRIHRRTAGLFVALQQAGAVEPEARRCLNELEERRRLDAEQALALVAGSPVSRQEIDGLWAIGIPEVYRCLTGSCGWTDQQYEKWSAHIVNRLLSRPTRKVNP